jgi:hypothetical protein
MKHNFINKEHITISLGVSRWWLSLVEIDELGYKTKELALVEFVPDDNSISVVPLDEWFDSASVDDVIFLNRNVRYHLLENATEGEIIAEAIIRATSFVGQ